MVMLLNWLKAIVCKTIKLTFRWEFESPRHLFLSTLGFFRFDLLFIVMKNCKKCNIEFNPSKGLINYCSLKCRNTRIFSEDSNLKKRNATKQKWVDGVYDFMKTGKTPNKNVICKHCQNIFSCDPYKNQHYCSMSCSKQSVEHREKMSKIVKEQYKKGKNIYGGRTKWVEVNTSKGIFKVQGSYERITCEILDKWLLEKKINDWEYTKDRFQYVNINGKLSTYLLDFKIFDNHGFYYLETKGRVVENDYLKWKSVRNYGHRLVVWYENDIKKYGV